MTRQFNLTLALTAALVLISNQAYAVSPSDVPNVAQPAKIQDRIKIENVRPDVGGDPVVTVTDENGLDKSLAKGATFTLKGVTIKDGTVFSAEELSETYKDLIGTKVSLANLTQIANKITAKYRNSGYILSRAVIPPQRVTGGVVNIRIVEGFVNKVVFEGLKDESSRLADYANKIRNAKPLDSATLERYMLLMEDLPGVSVHAVIRPAAGVPGASDVVIKIDEKPVDASASIDNRGTRYIGPVEFSATAALNNALGIYERTQVRLFAADNTNELKYGQITHEQQLDDEGTKVVFSAGRTRTNPGFRLRNLQITGYDTAFTADVSHPFIRSRETNLFANLKFDIRNTDTDALSAALFRDRLRVLRAGTAYDFVDDWTAINRVEATVSKGFGWWDNAQSNIRSRATGEMNFWKFNAKADRLQPIDGPFTLYLAAQGQKSANTLLTAEQFSVGGADFGSAYDPSEILGDSGIAARSELQYNHDDGTGNFMSNFQAYGFYDIGSVWVRTASGNASRQSLASAGLGMRFNAFEPVSGGIEVALPLTRDVAAYGADGSAPRIFFNMAYRY
jgi:hemolysin activation/secretion protein